MGRHPASTFWVLRILVFGSPYSGSTLSGCFNRKDDTQPPHAASSISESLCVLIFHTARHRVRVGETKESARSFGFFEHPPWADTKSYHANWPCFFSKHAQLHLENIHHFVTHLSSTHAPTPTPTHACARLAHVGKNVRELPQHATLQGYLAHKKLPLP